MQAMLMYLEIIVKIRQKVALGAVYNAIKPTHHLMVHYAKVAFIIGGTELLVNFFLSITEISSSHFLFTNAHTHTLTLHKKISKFHQYLFTCSLCVYTIIRSKLRTNCFRGEFKISFTHFSKFGFNIFTVHCE